MTRPGRLLLSLVALAMGCDDGSEPHDPADVHVVDTRPATDSSTSPEATMPGADLDLGPVRDAASPQPDAGPDVDPQQEFYDRSAVQDIALEIAPDDRQAMFDALPELIYVPATFRWRDIEIENVGVRFKGNSSSQPQAWWKRSLLIKFGEFVEGQRFLGLRRVALDNAVQFGSLFSERLLTDVLRAEGVPCSRANYATVTINGVDDGLFVNVERIDKSFLERVFMNRDGVLYKNHLGGPGSDLRALASAADYAASFEPKTHTDQADYSEILELAELLRDTPDEGLAAALEARFDLEPFLKLMAVMVFGGAFDQYTGFNAHNYYLYDDPATGRISYLVWDLDVGFADRAFGRVPVIDGWNPSWPLPQTPRPLLERILSNDGLRARYLAHADRILETWFRPEVLGAELDILFAQARAPLARDPYPPRRVTVPDDRGYDTIVDSLKAFMDRRYATARARLDDPATEPPMPMPPMDDGPQPGPAGPDDPTDLIVDAIDAEGVHLSWTDNSEREAVTVVQRCTGAGCMMFRNRAGVPAQEPARFVDANVQPGQHYRYRAYAAWPTPGGAQGSGTSNVVDATP